MDDSNIEHVFQRVHQGSMMKRGREKGKNGFLIEAAAREKKNKLFSSRPSALQLQDKLFFQLKRGLCYRIEVVFSGNFVARLSPSCLRDKKGNIFLTSLL